MAPILDYIRDNLAEPLTLDQIAGRFFISKHYLCRIFKSATGFSVMEYIIYSRILRARQLLQEGCLLYTSSWPSLMLSIRTPSPSAPSIRCCCPVPSGTTTT